LQAHPHVLPQSTLLGGDRYFLGPVLGAGSFGVTYRAVDRQLGRIVAVKEYFPEGSFRQGATIVPPPSLGRDGYEAERAHFIEEARLLARFQRAGIVAVHEVFEQNDTAYMVMEYIAGRTLVEVLQERGSALPADVAVRYVLAVAAALGAMHEEHLLHRDVKPGNIMITRTDEAVLIDFGAARAFDRRLRTSAMTAIGTPGYAPLEQWASSGRFGPASDVYALAATLYHLVMGRMPPSAADRVVSDTLQPPHALDPAIPEEVSEAVVRGLALRMDDRPQTMAAFAQLLRSPVRPARVMVATAPPSVSVPRPDPRTAPPAPQRSPEAVLPPADAHTPPPAPPSATPPADAPPAPSQSASPAQPAPSAPRGRRRLFPWPRRQRDRVFWATGVVAMPLVLAPSVLALVVLVPLFATASVTFSGSPGRAARAGLKRSLRFGLHGLGACAVSVASLFVVGGLALRATALNLHAAAHSRP
jgi:serine/threonine protein kinase